MISAASAYRLLILLVAIFIGAIAGLIRGWVNHKVLHVPDLRLIWLVPVAFLPQLLAFQIPATQKISDNLAATALISSQLLLLIFALANIKKPGFWLLSIGLILNLTVIGLNTGLMPISPETVKRLAPNAPPDSWRIGERLGRTKEIVLPVEATRLWYLSDVILLPKWSPYQVAFSMGDILVACGAFLLMWSIGRENKIK